MTWGRLAAIGAFAVVAGAVAWALFVALPKRYGAPTRPSVAASKAPTPPAAPGRKIKARLFYLSPDGASLTGVEGEVAFGETTVDQAREIVAAQVAPVADPLLSPIPVGTSVRSVYLSEKGEAYIDLSRDVVSAHTGGTLDELLTVYALVNALTTNLPAVQSVQLLVEGQEVPTLAGHVDLRRPLTKNLDWVQ